MHWFNCGLFGSRGTQRAVRVGQLDVDAIGNVAVGRGAADVEAAQLALTAGEEAVVGRSHIAAEALHIAQLRAQAKDVAAVGRRDQVVHRHEALVSHRRRDVTHVSADAGHLERQPCIPCRCAGVRVVDGVVGVGERGRAVDDASQRIGSLNARPEADGREEGLRRGERR